MKSRSFTVILHKEEDVYIAECSEVGTVDQGDDRAGDRGSNRGNTALSRGISSGACHLIEECYFSAILLKGFYQALKYEWAGEAKNPDDFEKLGPKIVIVLDNASIHKKKGILEQIAKEMPNLILEFLPEYSPDYNLIELVWHLAKEFISNRLFESIEALEALVNKLLNEGELVINWARNIKSKGNNINAV